MGTCIHCCENARWRIHLGKQPLSFSWWYPWGKKSFHFDEIPTYLYICILEVPEEKREGAERTYEQIMDENFPKLMKSLNSEFLYDSVNTTPRYISKRNENVCPHIMTFISVHNSTIHNAKNRNNLNVINWWMNKENMVYPCSGISSSYKEEWSIEIYIYTQHWQTLEASC